MYEILIRWGIPKKLVNLVQICLKNTRGSVKMGNQMSETFNIQRIEAGGCTVISSV